MEGRPPLTSSECLIQYWGSPVRKGELGMVLVLSLIRSSLHIHRVKCGELAGCLSQLPMERSKPTISKHALGDGPRPGLAAPTF